MSAKESQQLLLTKLEVARRQLNAAIRMYFRDDDELAIHVVGHAAFRIIRDILRSRDNDIHESLMTRGMFEMLKAHAKGQLHSTIGEDEAFRRFVATIPDSMLAMIAEKDFEDVQARLIGYNPASFWGEFNKSCNFLKHANLDPEKVLDPDRVDNLQLLGYACGGYGQLNLPPSVEMWTYLAYFMSVQPFDITFPEGLVEKVRVLRRYEAAQRKSVCRYVIGDTFNTADEAESGEPD